jgi:hypothetical protein
MSVDGFSTRCIPPDMVEKKIVKVPCQYRVNTSSVHGSAAAGAAFSPARTFMTYQRPSSSCYSHNTLESSPLRLRIIRVRED